MFFKILGKKYWILVEIMNKLFAQPVISGLKSTAMRGVE